MITTDIDYPASLPCPSWDGYDINHVAPFKRTTMQSGRGRPRRTFTSVPSTADVEWVFMSHAHAMAFEAWFRDMLNDGTEWFNTPLKTPLGVRQYVCAFKEMYRGPQNAGMAAWRFRAPLEIYERPLLPRGWGIVPDMVAGMSIFDLAMNREWPEA